MKTPRRIALAYSGGLDTSVIIPWLLENHPGCEVLAAVLIERVLQGWLQMRVERLVETDPPADRAVFKSDKLIK